MNPFKVHDILILVSGLALSMVSQSSGQKPVRTSEASVNYAAPPATLEEFVRLSSAVIVGHIVGASSQGEWQNKGYEVFTNYQISISEVIKPHSQLPVVGTVVTVKRLGGDFDAGDHIVRGIEHEFPQFSTGETYLLFLHWNDSRSTFQVRAGPNGAYRVWNGVLHSVGRSALANQQKGRSIESVLAQLRTVIQN